MRWHAIPKRQAGACVSLSKHRSLTTWILVAACAVYSLLLIASSRANLPFKRRGRGLSISRDGREHITAARSEKDVRETNEEAYEQWRRSAAMYPSVDCSCEAYEALSSPAAHRASTQQNNTTASSLQDTMAPQRIDTSNRQLSLSAEFLSEVYVISLASRPDRRQYMCAVLQRLGVPALLWPAISADDQQVSSIRQDLVQERKHQVQLLAAHHSHAEQDDEALTPQGLPPGADSAAWQHLRQHDEVLTAGEVACYASHRAVWRDAAARDATGPLLVLEDDADPEAGFVAAVRGALARLPQEWDVLWVGSCYEETLQAAVPEKVAHRLYRAKGPMCTHAYLLRSSAAAAALLRHAGNITDPWAAADHAMLRAVRTSGMHAYVMLPPPVAQLPHDVPPPLPPPPLQPPQPPPAGLVSYNDRVAAKQQQRQQQRHHGGTLAFPRPGAPRHNPSTVRERRSWLPRQRIVHPVRELLLSEEAAAAGAGAAAGATWNRTCGLPIFALQLPPGTPPAAMAFGDGEYLP